MAKMNTSKLSLLAKEYLDCDKRIKAIQAEQKVLKNEIEKEIEQEIVDQLSGNEYGTGTANIDAGQYQIKAVISKKVEWDQQKLAEAHTDMVLGGQDPDEYLKTTHTISETEWKKMAIRNARIFRRCSHYLNHLAHHYHQPEKGLNQMDFVNIKRTVETKPPRLVVYGPQGTGKTTFASQAPDVIFMQIEDGLDGIESYKQRVTSFGEAMQMLEALYTQDHQFTTLAVDSADWLEALIFDQVVSDWNEGKIKTTDTSGSNKRVSSVDEIGYGKGFAFALGYWEEFIQALDALRADKQMTIILIAHDKIKRFDDPLGSGYDQYMLKLNDKASALLQEWADGVLFMKLKTVTVTQEGGGFNKKSTKGRDGGGVVMHTKSSPAYQAKNRTMLSLPDEFYVSRENGWDDFENAIGQNKPVVKVNTPVKTKKPKEEAAA